MVYAHSRNTQGHRQALEAHLRATSQRAAEFAQAMGADEIARFLGLWHDIGKFHPQFQRYLMAVETGSPRPRAPDHKAAGSLLARKHLGMVAMPVQGHHGGLQTPTQFDTWIREGERAALAQEALRLARQAMPDIEPDGAIPLPPHVLGDPLAAELFLRLLFSALVDADFLDTEAHFSPEKAAVRGGVVVNMADLWRRLEQAQAAFSGQRADRVAQARHEIYRYCVQAAESPPGLFRLTVPTGGGKTRSAMAFALRHASLHGLKRVIVAIPFISITEQTARTYRSIFGPDAVLEHHSGRTAERREDDVSWDGLAAENWDAPIVVTTTVQLFESLFANGPAAVRKLHRLAASVIILDEAQSLPPHLLTPILDALRGLAAHYRTTIVFSTATQPAFSSIPAFRDMPACDIVPDAQRYFDALRRVVYEWRTEPAVTWDEVADIMCGERQALAVVNTKANALALLDALEGRIPPAPLAKEGRGHVLHLSTLLCGAHRCDVLDEVKQRLASGDPCHLISTQVVEAGVDLDFPVVLRAVGPLDSIIQAAGRCNREGRLDRGRAIIFLPQDGGMPSGAYRTAADITYEFIGRSDLDDPATPAAYFSRLFHTVDTDGKGIQEMRKVFDFPAVADAFRMIQEDTEEVVVPYGDKATQEQVKEDLERLRRGDGNARTIVRRLQPYMVKLWRRQAEAYRRQGFIVPVMDRLGEWFGRYDNVRGIVAEDRDPDAYVV